MSERGRGWERIAPLLLLVGLAAAWALPEQEWLTMDTPDSEAEERMTATLDDLPAEPMVVVGFDPDLGTYAEVRPTVRALIDDLLARDAQLAFVSLTPEGRALALAEIDRLDLNGEDVTDLGFLPGAEAALVTLTRAAPLASADAAVLIGGNDLGPRTWVEQVAPRIEGLTLVAVAPTVLLPQLQPYLGTDQLDALLATPREGAAYRASLGDGASDDTGRMTLPILLGLLVALGVVGGGLGARMMRTARGLRTSDGA